MLVDKVALGRRIKAMRQNLEMTQEEFADRLNCTNSHLGKIENGKGGISIELLFSVANNESERLSGSYWAALRFIWGGIIQIGGEHYDER